MIDQSAVGVSTRSNPATYAAIMDDVRKAFANANQVSASLFSFSDVVRSLLKFKENLLVIDVRDAADVAQTGTVPGAINVSYGALTYMADQDVPESWRHPQLADRSRPVVTTCIAGPLGALGGKRLHDMGFTNVQILEGGVQAWIDAELPIAGQQKAGG